LEARRVSSLATVVARHFAPRMVGASCRFSSFAMALSLVKPAARSLLITVPKAMARASAARFVAAPPLCPRLRAPRPASRVRSTAVRFGIRAIRKEAERCLMHPGRDTIGRRPDFPISHNGRVKRRLLGTATEFDPGSDAARWWLVLNAAANFRLVEALQDNFQGGRSQQSRHGTNVAPSMPIESPYQGSGLRSMPERIGWRA
jgi:hypothetical protein